MEASDNRLTYRNIRFYRMAKFERVAYVFIGTIFLIEKLTQFKCEIEILEIKLGSVILICYKLSLPSTDINIRKKYRQLYYFCNA